MSKKTKEVSFAPLKALDEISNIPLYHLDYEEGNFDEGFRPIAFEAYDGTVEENHPRAIRTLRKQLKKAEKIHEFEVDNNIDVLILIKALKNGIYYPDGTYTDDHRLYLTNYELYDYHLKRWLRYDRYGIDWALTPTGFKK